MPILSIDGSDIQIPTNPENIKLYNLLHINALYNMGHSIYDNVIIQKSREKNEHKALQQMVDQSVIPKAFVIADRG